ncbi:hypothetical protein DID88_008774 [Monilinia fructigena]|uniref:Uncharacterized protein n=1 Tax=Monilinia fructigena TaxID=38457 RepID=A0A395J6T6_9HELO|nr:hypothetical protein DID88_008774 [Monilinia fructigena]
MKEKAQKKAKKERKNVEAIARAAQREVDRQIVQDSKVEAKRALRLLGSPVKKAQKSLKHFDTIDLTSKKAIELSEKSEVDISTVVEGEGELHTKRGRKINVPLRYKA